MIWRVFVVGAVSERCGGVQLGRLHNNAQREGGQSDWYLREPSGSRAKHRIVRFGFGVLASRC